MRKYLFVLLALLVFASCEEKEPQQYSIQRLNTVEETSADGSSKRVSKYTYFDDGYLIRTTVNGALAETCRLVFKDNLEIHSDSTVVDGVLQPSGSLTVYYMDSNRSMVDSVVTRNPAGETISVDEYSFDTSFNTIITKEGGVKTKMRVISSYYSTQTTQNYVYDTETEDWKYVNKEETITSYDHDITIVTYYVDNLPKEKTMYQWQNGRMEFKTYTYDGVSSWTLTTSGFYSYETLYYPLN